MKLTLELPDDISTTCLLKQMPEDFDWPVEAIGEAIFSRGDPERHMEHCDGDIRFDAIRLAGFAAELNLELRRHAIPGIPNEDIAAYVQAFYEAWHRGTNYVEATRPLLRVVNDEGSRK